MIAASFTTFPFFVFFATVLALYYLVPVRYRTWILLPAGAAFYMLTGNPFLILFPIASAAIVFAGALLLGKEPSPKRKRLVLIPAVLLLIGSVILLKYLHPFGNAFVPLGISFYTFTLLSYLLDVANGLSEPEKNPLRVLSYGLYFPNILSGPILRYREDEKPLRKEHPFSYRNLTFGLQRMLWGLFKILVISERCAVITDTVYEESWNYGGFTVIFAAFLYAFQLYANFSGSMDLALGMSECFGIRMPENFDVPFLSESIAEFWRRWHITLGVWMKEYLFYPLLRTKFFTNLSSKNRERFGKKTGKMLTTFAGMFILWLSVGLWHGGDIKYVIGSGLLHWIYIMLEECFEKPVEKFWAKLGIDKGNRILRAGRVLRTFLLVVFSFIFFRALSVSQAFSMIRSIFASVPLEGGITSLGLSYIELTILAVSLLIMMIVEAYGRKHPVRELLAAKKLPVRWVLLYALLFYVILLGYYGPGFDPAAFIYQGF